MKSFISVQMGARRSYAVPSILEEAGMLESSYTDICGNHGFTGDLLKALPDSMLKGSLKDLSGRQLPENLSKKTTTFPYLTLKYILNKQLFSKNEEAKVRAFSQFAEDIGNAIVRKGFGNATHYFSMFGEFTPALRYAKAKGLTTVTEIFIILNAYRLVEEERAKYPDLEPAPDEKLLKEGLTWLQEVCALSDWFITPSEAVKQDLIDNWGVKGDRCLVVPYGVDESWLKVDNSPVKGRVLMVGTADLRKGIHILGESSENLNQQGYEFRVAGDVTAAVKNAHITRALTFLGRIPRVDVYNEYESADVFVLPSFAEGSAEATYEALACGIPVITTAAAGSVVRDGIDGYIVPEGDSATLVDKIRSIVENRELRNQMAISARERARQYTWDKYGERLISVLNKI